MLVRITDTIEKSQTKKNSSVYKNHAQTFELYFGDQKKFPDNLNAFYPFLSEQELSRSKRFTKKADERTYVISHALLNKKISEQKGVNFDQLYINYFANRKPYIVNSIIDFNLSHSSDFFAFIVSNYENIYVGIDIEMIRKNLDIEPIMNSYFHKNEISYILTPASNNLLTRQKFYEIWTRKEAFLKMLGSGLSEMLSELDMSPGVREIMVQNKGAFTNPKYLDIYVYTLKISKEIVVSLSVNCPAILLLEHIENI